MKFWWVNHKQTHHHELGGGYIWSPKRNINGAFNQTYTNLTLVHPGDYIFSFADTVIKAVGVIKQAHVKSDRPREFGGTGEQWDTNGWKVLVTWMPLDVPIHPKSHIDTIRPLLPSKYSPLLTNGNGNQAVYLGDISSDLGKHLMQLIFLKNPGVMDGVTTLDTEVLETQVERKIATGPDGPLQKERLIMARRGQGYFRNQVERAEGKCRFTGVTNKQFLVASHIKPWHKSLDAEKIDANNGLLLSPHIDKLFDKGLITITDDGAVLCANTEVTEVLRLWGVDPARNVGKFNAGQKTYLAFHRQEVYLGKLP